MNQPKTQAMKNPTQPLAPPSDYPRCFNTQCPKAAECLRQLAAQQDDGNRTFLTAVNPKAIPPSPEACPHFKPARKVRLAWGVKNLFDTLPQKQAKVIKAEILRHFGRTKYYRIYRHETYMEPGEQEYIRKTFLRNGIRENPVFDKYTEGYVW